MKIDAAVIRSADAPFTIEALELSDPGPHQARIRIVGAGHCHTDLLPRVANYSHIAPIVVGHEGAGIVESIGDAVTTLAVGDHVVLSFDSCGVCPDCRDGHPAYCRTFMQRNLTGTSLDGCSTLSDGHGSAVAGRWFGQSSFATHAVIDERNAVVVDKDLPLELLGPIGCGIQTGAGSVFNVLGVRAGDGMVVTGAGAVGLSAIMAAQVAGASPIIAVDLNTDRLELARELGATHTIVGGTGDLTTQIRAIAPDGVRYGLDTTGLPLVISAALAALSLRGVLGMVGVQLGDLVIAPRALTAGRTLTGILEGDSNPQTFIPTLIALWRAGRFPFDRLLTTYPLSDINIAEQQSRAGAVIKPILLPSPQGDNSLER